MRSALELAHVIAVRNAAQLARERLRRTESELRSHLAEHARIRAAALGGRRSSPGPTLAPWRVSPRDAERNVVRPWDEPDRALWPFDGELWRDEIGYRQSIRSLCK